MRERRDRGSNVHRILQPPHNLLRGSERPLYYFTALLERLIHIGPLRNVVVRRQREQPDPIILSVSQHSTITRDPIPVHVSLRVDWDAEMSGGFHSAAGCGRYPRRSVFEDCRLVQSLSRWRSRPSTIQNSNIFRSWTSSFPGFPC